MAVGQNFAGTPTNMDGSWWFMMIWWWNVFELFWHVLRLDGLQGLHIIISIIKWWPDKFDGSGYSRYPTCPILILPSGRVRSITIDQPWPTSWWRLVACS
jgi:hypothetical protein